MIQLIHSRTSLVRLWHKSTVPSRLECFKCTADLDDMLECAHCHAIQPPPQSTATKVTYFHLLSPRPRLLYAPLDPNQVKQCLRRLQLRCHPDRVTKGTACERVALEAWSAWANRAYDTLKDPLKRARYLYSLLCESDTVGDDESVDTADKSWQELFLQVMEKREVIEASRNPTELEVIKVECEQDIAADEKALTVAFEAEDCAAVKRLIGRMRYWMTLKGVCEDRLEIYGER